MKDSQRKAIHAKKRLNRARPTEPSIHYEFGCGAKNCVRGVDVIDGGICPKCKGKGKQ